MFNYLSILYKLFAVTAWSTAIILIVNDSINNSIVLPSLWLKFSLVEKSHQQDFNSFSRATITQEQSSVDGYFR
ncbi:MAG: hypothetical protein QNJ54_34465 [Prochloraceae cyanobacterium]|nr:hypothetical protein [Prochloraceae cyanobacterium]